MSRVDLEKSHQHAYTTEQEVLFIDFLGRHTVEGQLMGRLPMLVKYRAALLHRKDWGMVDRVRVMKHIDLCIAEAKHGSQ